MPPNTTVNRMTTVSFSTDNTSILSAPSHYYSVDDDAVSSPHSDVVKFAGIITKDMMATVENVINIGVLPMLVIIGAVTNVFNLVVFARLGLSDRINICLFSLSLADLCYVVLMMARKSYSILALVDPSLGQYWKVTSMHTVVGVYWSFMNISSAITMIISLERCACVLAPLHAKTLIRSRSMAVVMVCVFVFVQGVYGLFNLKYVTLSRPDPHNPNGTVYAVGLGSFYLRHRTVIDIFYVYILSIIIPTTSLVVVIITTAVTTAQLHLSLAWRQQSAQQSIKDTREIALTKMLVCLCCVYVVCVTPKVLMPMVRQYMPEWQPLGRYANLHDVVNACMHVLSVFNSSVNFFFYWALGSKYRATLRHLCVRCWPSGLDSRSSAVLESKSLPHK